MTRKKTAPRTIAAPPAQPSTRPPSSSSTSNERRGGGVRLRRDDARRRDGPSRRGRSGVPAPTRGVARAARRDRGGGRASVRVRPAVALRRPASRRPRPQIVVVGRILTLFEAVAELGERRPARIAVLFLVLVRLDVQVLPAHRAQARAVVPAQDLLGHSERDRVARPRVQRPAGSRTGTACAARRFPPGFVAWYSRASTATSSTASSRQR